MMLKLKITLLCIAIFIMALGSTVFAGELQVTKEEYQSGKVKLEVPVIKGSIGGMAVDNAVNKVIVDRMFARIENYLSETEGKAVLQQDDMVSLKKTVAKIDGVLKSEAATGKWSGYSVDVASKVELHDEKFISLVLKSSIFTGGAHPNKKAATFNFDLTNGNQITLSELFVEGSDYKSRLEQMVSAWLELDKRLNDSAVQAENSGWTPEIKITDSQKYYVSDDKELVLLFDPYEAGPYSEGFKECAIPLSLLGDILGPIQITQIKS